MNKQNYLREMLLSIGCLAFILGCQKQVDIQSDKVLTRSTNMEQINVDTSFLGFEGDLIIPEVIWENIGTYSLAYDRMARHLQFEENKISWNLKSAQEINISQNIYDYVISGWRQDSIKLESGAYTLKIDGIYYYLEPKQFPLIPRSPFLLLKGNHDVNMRYCINLVRSGYTGWLGTVIDLGASEMEPDGFGGLWIRGMKAATDSNGSPYLGYAVFNASPMSLNDRLNYVCGSRNDGHGDLFYEKLVNCNHSPLVSVLNAHLYLLQSNN